MANKIWFVAALVLALAWQVHGQVNCTATGAGRFPVPGDTTCQNYTYCIYVSSSNTYLSYNYVCPTTSLFDPSLQQCTTTYVCTVNSTTNATTSVCTADGFVADPSVTDCSSYIQCVLINGSYVETTYTCPADTFYDPTTTLCEADYTCAFNCSAAGRFANTADSTCQTYYLCVLANNGTYLQYEYTCPSTSVFSPTSSLCTTTYTCTG